MQVTASRLFKELGQGKWSALNLIVGDEPFQIREIIDRFKAKLFSSESELEFNLESYEGGSTSYGQLLEALQQFSGLFAEESGTRLVLCRDLDKLGEAALEKMVEYFQSPSESTCFIATVTKPKKKSKWYTAWSKNGHVIDVHEPFERDWTKWKSFFENKCGKKIAADAWPFLLDTSNRRLAALWTEVDKLSTYVEPRSEISLEDVLQGTEGKSLDNIFSFGEAVLGGDRFAVAKQYRDLIESGENEIKIHSLIVKQYRLLYQCLKLKEQGGFELADVAKQVGAHPYFLTKLLNKADSRAKHCIKEALDLLAECDFDLKLGRGSFFENFCIPYFALRGSGLHAL